MTLVIYTSYFPGIEDLGLFDPKVRLVILYMTQSKYTFDLLIITKAGMKIHPYLFHLIFLSRYRNSLCSEEATTHRSIVGACLAICNFDKTRSCFCGK